MVIRLSGSCKNTQGLKRNNNTKFIATPHRRSTVMVKQTCQRDNRKLGCARQAVHKQLQINLQKASITQRNQGLYPKVQRVTPFIHTTLEHHKNSAEDISDERAIDAFTIRLRLSDFVKEMGRIKPKTISELMDIANKFADGEDAYHNKRT
jgi:hypothetical protein